MSKNPPPPRSPDASPDRDMINKQVLVLSHLDAARLKDCIVAASASVWGVPTMRPTQLGACYHLLHPHHPNSLVVVHRTGGGETHIPRTLGVIERGIILI